MIDLDLAERVLWAIIILFLSYFAVAANGIKFFSVKGILIYTFCSLVGIALFFV